MKYLEYLENKRQKFINRQFGINVDEKDLNSHLFDFQKHIVKLALSKGQYAIFAECGLGKTICQLEFARHVVLHTKMPVLILCPLAVSGQTIQEGKKFGIEIHRLSEKENPIITGYGGMWITNYEQLENIDASIYSGIVLDECFAPDTKIQVWRRDGSLHEQDIKDCKIGENVLNCLGLKKIKAIKKRKVTYAIKIGFNGKTIISSPKHPYFTQRGWVTAKEIQETDFIISTDKTMRILRGEFSDNLSGICENQILRSVLLSEMENETTSIFSKSTQSNSSSQKRIINQKSISNSKWTKEGRDVGWSHTSKSKQKRIGRKEGLETGYFRVDSFEVLELGCHELDKYRDETGALYFYDLEIEGHPSFTINNALVHNSSCLKNFTGKTRKLLTETFKNTPYRLCCTATPAPNDYNEIGNHSEFLGILDAPDMRSRWFVRDEGMNNYRLKNHGRKSFFAWISSWATMITNPADIGFDGHDFILPELTFTEHKIDTGTDFLNGRLFNEGIVNATNFNAELRKTMVERLNLAKQIAMASDGPVIIWVKQNDEADYFKKIFPEVVEVRGSEPPESKERKLLGFANNEFKYLLTKTKIAQFGLNFQNCHSQIFASLDFSFESLYQSVRRSYRFGQIHPVNINIITTDTMQNVIESIQRKEREFKMMQEEMNQEINHQTYGLMLDYEKNEYRADGVRLIKGDSCIEIKSIPDNSIDLIIYSPPFSSLFTYSNYVHDMGNQDSHEGFFEQYKFLLQDLYRILKPGRIMCCHTKDLAVYKNSSGYTGLYNFTGDHHVAVEGVGFKYHSKVTIFTDPVLEMQRTKTQRLLYKQVTQDSSYSGIGVPEYVTIFRKWEGNEEGWTPVTNLNKANFPLEIWQKWASPVWMDIQRTDVLTAGEGTDMGDEKHICLASGTLVLTQKGYIQIESVNIGDKVLTHKGNWKAIIKKQKTGINKTVIQVHAMGIPKLIVTPEHKLYAKKIDSLQYPMQSIINNPPEWIEAMGLKEYYIGATTPPEIFSSISAQEWWLIGRWLADGHIDIRRHQYFVSIGNHKLNDFKNNANKFIGGVYNKGSCTQIGLKGLNNEVRDILSKCGNGASNKVLPIEAISLSESLSEALLQGYLSGDGYLDKWKRWQVSSTSRALLLGMAIVIQKSRGTVASIYASSKKAGKHIIQGEKDLWVMIFSERNNRSAIIIDNVAWKKVTKIENNGKSDVWNIQVEDDESFVTEGCIVHNCPLQLEVINRLLHMYSNEGETIFTPFLGIGSEAYVAVKNNRKAIGIELKDSYFNTAVKNIQVAMIKKGQMQLW